MPQYSIYSPQDPRYQSAAFNQQTGQMGFYPGSTVAGLGGTTGAQSGTSALPNYNTAPQPTSGQGPYGMVPGTIGIPPSAWQQTIGAAPGLGNTSQLTGNIMHELQGDINPQTLKNMQDAAASYGVQSGMPGSNAIPGTLAFNKNLRNIGLDTMAVQQQGQKDYLSALQGISGTQTPQALAAEIAAHNAQLRAAPDPAAAAQQQLNNYWNALRALRGPGGGTGGAPMPGGGTGNFATAPVGLGFGGLGSAGSPLGAGFGSPVSRNSNTSTGDPFYDFWDQGTPVNPSDSGVSNPYQFGPDYSFGAPPNTNQGTDLSTYNPYSQYGAPFGGYDQSAAPTAPSDMTDEEYFYNYS